MQLQYMLPALLVLSACANDASGRGAPGANTCPVEFIGEWKAWVDAMPPGPNMLIVRGQVVAPTPGYQAVWREGFADRRLPPGQHFFLEFTPPDGVVAQVITTMDVEYRNEAAYPEYRAVIVHCGDDMEMEITPVPVAL
jgi:hypothetical protein